MTARVTANQWTPLPGSLPVSVEAGKVYVIPTRSVGPRDDGAIQLCYPDNVRYLPKAARANGLPVEFSLPEATLEHLQEFIRLIPRCGRLDSAC